MRMTILTVPGGPRLFVLNFGEMLLCFGLLEYCKSHHVPVGWRASMPILCTFSNWLTSKSLPFLAAVLKSFHSLLRLSVIHCFETICIYNLFPKYGRQVFIEFLYVFLIIITFCLFFSSNSWQHFCSQYAFKGPRYPFLIDFLPPTPSWLPLSDS